MNYMLLGFVLLFIFFYASLPVNNNVPEGSVMGADGKILKRIILPKGKIDLE
nr:venom polypeptide precursor [Doratifera vulnerans]